MTEEHKFDKYGCLDENCKEHYPVISRKSIMAEVDSGEEYRKGQELCEECLATVPLKKDCEVHLAL